MSLPQMGEGRQAVTHLPGPGTLGGDLGNPGACAGLGVDGFRCAAPILHADSQGG